MRSYFNNPMGNICLLTCIFFVFHANLSFAQTPGNPATPQRVPTSDQVSRTDEKMERYITIDFNNVDITIFIKFISELTGKNFVVDRRVKGKVTIISPTKISIKEAYRVFQSVLEVHGYSTVQAGQVIKIVPSPDARTKSIETKLKEEAAFPDDKVVTQLIPLTYADPDEVKRLFTPLVSKSSVILSYPPTNMLIVTDVYSNIQRLMRILKAIDVTGIGQEISVVPLEFSDAAKLATVLKSVFQTSQKPKKGGTPKVFQFVADERTNTIILLASEVDTARVKRLIRLLDKQVPRGKEKIHVYYLENATAEDLAKVLQALPEKTSSSAKGPKKSPIVSEKVNITPDKATNSLIIMADKDDYLVLEEIIEKLDIPRTMVYIECLIMEVDVDKDFNVGTEWTAMTEVSYQGKEGAAGGGYSGADPGYSNLGGVAAGNLPVGFSLGVFTEALQIGGVQFPNLAAIVQAYQKDKDVHILSTPQILTTDNEEATIHVGKNVPYQTRSAAEVGLETYSSYEYKDVGITLKITPQISEERLVRLNIFQEISKLDELSTTSPDRPTTLKRTIETTVIVKDGRTIVIGGLIEDVSTSRDYKVPCLGEIPLLGWLFRSYSWSGEKTNLFIFLTPKVVKRPVEAETINREKRDLIDKIKEGKIKLYE